MVIIFSRFPMLINHMHTIYVKCMIMIIIFPTIFSLLQHIVTTNGVIPSYLKRRCRVHLLCYFFLLSYLVCVHFCTIIPTSMINCIFLYIYLYNRTNRLRNYRRKRFVTVLYIHAFASTNNSAYW